jgi:ParB/RepB/Spo0J family partition protein
MNEVVGQIVSIPLTDIYADHAFNCRGLFQASEVYDLGKDIEAHGQLQPLLVQPRADIIDLPEQYKYKLISGYRRFVAINTWTSSIHAECIIREGLDADAVSTLNFLENLQRKNLNILQEALTIGERWPDESIRPLAKKLGVTDRWVSIRRDLLILPEEMQTKAALGPYLGISQADIQILASVSDDARQLESAYRQILERKKTKSHKPIKVGGKIYRRGHARGQQEIKATLGLIYTNTGTLGLNDRERDLVAATMAWASRAIDSKEFFTKRLDGKPRQCIINDKDKLIEIKNSKRKT